MHLYTSTLPLILACILLLLIMRIEISSKSPNGVLDSYMLNAEQMLVFPQTAQSEKSEEERGSPRSRVRGTGTICYFSCMHLGGRISLTARL